MFVFERNSSRKQTLMPIVNQTKTILRDTDNITTQQKSLWRFFNRLLKANIGLQCATVI